MAERERRVISLVGGGGKTTTMYALAEIFREEGKKVIVTTSTHLQTPPEEIRAWNIEEVRSLWNLTRLRSSVQIVKTLRSLKQTGRK